MDRAGSRYSNDIAYLVNLPRHRQILPHYQFMPLVGPQTFLAPDSTLGTCVHSF